MSARSAKKSMPWLCETFTAAMNCPRFLKPLAARIGLAASGSRDRTFSIRCSFFKSFCWVLVGGTTGPVSPATVGVVWRFVLGAFGTQRLMRSVLAVVVYLDG